MRNEQKDTNAMNSVARPALTRVRFALVALSLIMVLSLASAGGASAAYEQAKEGTEPVRFGTPEAYLGNTQFSYSTSVAINPTGVGGVPPGSFYVDSGQGSIMRFSPGKDGEVPALVEEWGWGRSKEDLNAFVRCGPAYQGTANPAEHTYEECYHPVGPTYGEQPGQFGQHFGIALDKNTGNIYVRSVTSPVNGTGAREHNLVQVFTARGEIVGDGFGDSADGKSSPPSSILQSPEKLHGGASPGIAVDSAGTVYLPDQDYLGVENPKSRLMSFKPCSTGDYEHYCYAAGNDLTTPTLEGALISMVGDKHIVVASQELMQEYSLSAPGSGPDCSQSLTGQLTGMTTNEVTGEVFWARESDKRLRRLGPCDESTGKWSELDVIKPKLATAGPLGAMAVNPTKSWGPLRPAGVLYAVEYGYSDTLGTVFIPAIAGNPPAIEFERATNTSTISSVLTARLDPRGSDVSFHFEYLSDADYVANGNNFSGPATPARVPVTDGLLPSGDAATVTAAIAGLSPGTTYHFRVIATSECEPSGPPLCETVGSGMEFTTFALGLGGLLDNRAYERVSPAEKHGGEVFPADSQVFSCLLECKPPGAGSPATYPMQSSPSGDAVSYEGFPFSASEGAVINSYVARRGAADWQTTTTTPLRLNIKRNGTHLAYSADLTQGVISGSAEEIGEGFSSGAYPNATNLYLQTTAKPDHMTPLVASPPPNRTEQAWAIQYAGPSPDFAGQFFTANDVLTQATDYAPVPPPLNAAESDLYEWRGGALSLVNVLPGNQEVAKGASFASFASVSPDAHTVSADGSRVFWAAGGKLFVREDGQETRELGHPGSFLSASESGDEVLFTDGCLYSLSAETCTDLTQGKGGFLGIAGQADDLSKLYFVDTAAFAGQNDRGEEAAVSKPNLYLYEDGAGTSFVATLDSSSQAWNSSPGRRSAEASPNGRYLTFTTKAQLTDFVNFGMCGRESIDAGRVQLIPGDCSEVYMYDSVTGHLNCVSCSPTGEVPRGNSHLRNIQGAPNWFPQPRYMTDQGRLFFDSEDRLSPYDVNGRVEDVYEFEPSTVGSCERGSGCLSLVSPGTGGVDSNFFAMGGEGVREGADVFFTSREQLVRSDEDELIDLYVAREGGGFPEANLEPSECQGEACQPVIPRPAEVTPASSAFQGPGNVREPKHKKHKKAKHKKAKHKNPKHRSKHKSATRKTGRDGGAK